MPDAPRSGDRILEAIAPDFSSVPQAVFTDADIATAEFERIFAKTWLFVAHESELTAAGDYVTRRMGKDQVIVTRGDDDVIHVMRNACAHRGTLLCKATQGNTSHFMCPYHAWTFDTTGRLRGVPERRQVYGPLDKAAYGLRKARTESYQGLVFATWNPDAPALRDHLGDIAWYLDMLLGTATDGWEVGGPPQRYLAKGNWKLPSENLGGDSYHVAYTHRTAIESGLFEEGGSTEPPTGRVVYTEAGHTIRIGYMGEGGGGHPYWGFPADVRHDLESNATPEMLAVLTNANVVHGNIFPDLSFIQTALAFVGDETENIGFVSLRLNQPVDAMTTEMLTFVLVPRSADPEWKDLSILAYERTHGAASVIFEGDDQDNFGSIDETGWGAVGRAARVDYSMGTLLPDPVEDDWPGPGRSFMVDHSEFSHRLFQQTWSRMMKAGS